MFNLIKRAYKYVVAALTGKLEEVADPKIQIEQAIDEAKHQHELLSQQAAAVLGNRRELELKINRSLDEVEKLQASARQAITMADEARASNDLEKAGSFDAAAQSFATKLVSQEGALKDLKSLYERAGDSAEAAKQAVEQNALLLQKKLAERSKLLSQIEHTKMQERMNEAMKSVSQLAPGSDVPTLKEVSDKIEARYARAFGEAELQSGSVEVRMLEVEKAAIDVEAKKRLDELRKGLASGQAPAEPIEGPKE